MSEVFLERLSRGSLLQDSIMTVQRASILFNSVVENGPAFFHSEFTPAFEAEVNGAVRVRHTEGALGPCVIKELCLTPSWKVLSSRLRVCNEVQRVSDNCFVCVISMQHIGTMV